MKIDVSKILGTIYRGLTSFSRHTWQQIETRAGFWKRLFTIAVLVSFLYIFMEWFFFVTMPSFMNLMSLSNKVEVFLLSGLAFSLISIIVVVVFILLDIIALIAHFSRITPYLGIALPTIVLSALALLLVDNFTYTVFKFGISTTTGIARGAYGLLFVLLTGYFYFNMLKVFGLRGEASIKAQSVNRLFFASVGILAITSALALVRLDYRNIIPAASSANNQQAVRLPNIILLGSDGLNAENLSVYGYYRHTTPTLEVLAHTSIVAENAFTNAGNSAGSVISLFTSKLPTQTRLLYPPNILTGVNSFQHLPGILKNLGYTTVEYGVPFYIDAYNYNLQDGFDMVNNRTLSVGKVGELGRKLGYDNEVYFLSRLIGRISDRILHIFFIRTMENPFDIVTHPVPNITDEVKINRLLNLLDQTNSPVFVHAHLLGTHGGFYSPPIGVYSAGERQQQPWMDDFYDDTLIAFDAYVAKVIDHLKTNGQFENTILIIYTDHNKQFGVNERIPLIIHFPGGEPAARVTRIVQNLDIAPTILDYLGLPKPEWMSGESLLKDDPNNKRLIFSTGTDKIKPNELDVEFLNPEQNKPPFYQFSYINVIDCQMWYSFNLTDFKWSSGEVAGYVAPCSPQDLLSKDEIRQAVYDRLSLDGFDISSLP